MSLQCLLDMDGVLVDFTGAVETRYGVICTEWDFDERLPVSKEEFWKSCDEDFWAGLSWTKEGKQILEIVEKFFGEDNVCLLTSPCRTYGCMEGKMKWIQKHTPKYVDGFLMGRAKRFAAGPNQVLIDDRDKNIEKFIQSGGNGLLVPRPWNKANYLFDIEDFCVSSFLERALVNYAVHGD